jgi:hypothetical protein
MRPEIVAVDRRCDAVERDRPFARRIQSDSSFTIVDFDPDGPTNAIVSPARIRSSSRRQPCRSDR